MKRAAAVLAFAACCHALVLSAQPLLTPHTYRSHFQPDAGADPSSGSRDGWESFPITQETGYEPTLQPETHGGISALVRETAPTRSGDFQLGYIRRLSLVPGPSSLLTFSIRLPWDTGPTHVTASLFHGRREERLPATIRGAGWQTIRLHPASSQDAVTAIAIAADFSHAVSGRNERVELRDVQFRGLDVAMLPLKEPETLTDATRHVLYMQRAMHPGETLRAVAEANDAAQATWTLIAPDGTQRAMGRGVEVEHRFAPSEVTGVWTLQIATPAAETKMRLLLAPSRPSPLLFDSPPKISPALLASVRTRRDQLRALARVESGNNIAQMDRHWLLAGLPSYFDALLQSPELAMLDAIDYRSSGDPQSLVEAQRLLKGIAAWPAWTHPWFPAHGYQSYYPVGIAAKYVVVAEQFLGAELAAETRATLDQSLMRHVVVPIYTEYVSEDRLQFNFSNWIGNTAGGALLAALQSRQPDAAGYALGLFEKDRDHVRAAYTSDGSYGEGVTYHRFDFEMTSLVAEAAKRQLGISLDESFANSERYLTYASYGRDGLLDYGDSHVDITPSNVFAYVAAQNKSDAMREFYFRYLDTGTAELLSRVLWEAQIESQYHAPESKPPSAVFAERGIAVLRDGWAPDATVVAMRAGNNFNHNHADQGSVFFAQGGDLWLGEAGYADYYKDPSYPTYNIQAAGHNVLLVDDNPQSQVLPGNAVFGEAPRFEYTELGGGVQLVEADLTPAYRGLLQRYTRTLVFVPHGPLLVIDRVRSSLPHRFAQCWHPEEPLAGASPENAFTMQHNGETLRVEAFSTVSIGKKQSEAPLPLASYDLAAHGLIEHPQMLDFETQAAVNEAILATVITRGEEKASVTRDGGALHVRIGKLEVSILPRDAPLCVTSTGVGPGC